MRSIGLCLHKELDFSAKVADTPTEPVRGILGGPKVADRIQLIMHLLDKDNFTFIAGHMAFTSIREVGVEIGSSLYDEEGAIMIPEIRHKACKRYSQSATRCGASASRAERRLRTRYNLS